MSDATDDDVRYAAVTRADVLAAASQSTPVDDSDERVTISIDGISYDPLDVVARVLHIDPDRIRLRTAIEFLEHRYFDVGNPAGGASAVVHEHRQEPGTAPDSTTVVEGWPHKESDARPTTDAAHEGGEHAGHDVAMESRGSGESDRPALAEPVMTPEMAQQMQRMRGQWVAVNKGVIVKHAPVLRELLAGIGSEPVSVMFVPLKDSPSAAAEA